MLKKMIPVILILILGVGCSKKQDPGKPEAIAELNGNYLYADEIQKILPPNVSDSDSVTIVRGYIRKWAVNVLMYDKARQNVSNQSEIDQMVEDYRKSLTIHEYQQRLVEQKVKADVGDEDLQTFYKQYSDQLKLSEPVIKGLLLVVPRHSAQLAQVRSWVQAPNSKSLGSIEKYSIRNAISYDYFGDRWIPLAEVLRKMPLQVADVASFAASRHYVEATDSTRLYLLRIIDFRTPGQIEPIDMARDRIKAILYNKLKTDFLGKFENELYNDALKDKKIHFYTK